MSTTLPSLAKYAARPIPVVVGDDAGAGGQHTALAGALMRVLALCLCRKSDHIEAAKEVDADDLSKVCQRGCSPYLPTGLTAISMQFTAREQVPNICWRGIMNYAMQASLCAVAVFARGVPMREHAQR